MVPSGNDRRNDCTCATVMPEAGVVKIISDESNNSLTAATVSFLPSSVVAPPRAPPYNAVDCGLMGDGPVKAVADVAARPSTINDCIMIVIGGVYG